MNHPTQPQPMPRARPLPAAQAWHVRLQQSGQLAWAAGALISALAVLFGFSGGY